MSDLKFGTSGLRGLVTDLVGTPSRAYTAAFLRHLRSGGRPAPTVLIGRDLRGSSPGIAADCARAARAEGVAPVDCGALPTPALALEAMRRGAPAIMVTGSHIPDDRNGLKFYAATGEITKDDETGILAAYEGLAGAAPGETAGEPGWSYDAGETARAAYAARYADAWGPGALAGLSVGVYEHSSVARDLIPAVLETLGARVTRLGRAEGFVPVDTEAHRPEDRALVAGWAAEGSFDAIVSTDGDADRPLVADERGAILRGDVLGLLTARHIGAAAVVTPVTSASAIERAMAGARVIRTKVGSPFVLVGMEEALAAAPAGPVVGFEANGGVLLGSAVRRGDARSLPALPTRDALLPILAALSEIGARGEPLSQIVAGLDAGFTAADRLKAVPASSSGPFLRRLSEDADFAAAFFAPLGALAAVDRTDGVRATLRDGSILHFRASGNAPELRCYVEAATEDEAERRLAFGLDAAAKAMGGA